MFYSDYISYIEDIGDLYSKYCIYTINANVANESTRYYSIANESVIDAIKAFFKRIWDFITTIFSKLFAFIKAVLEKFISIFTKKAEIKAKVSENNKQVDTKIKEIGNIVKSAKDAGDLKPADLAKINNNLNEIRKMNTQTSNELENLAKNNERVRNEIKERHDNFNRDIDDFLEKVKENLQETHKTREDNSKKLDKLEKKIESLSKTKEDQEIYLIIPKLDIKKEYDYFVNYYNKFEANTDLALKNAIDDGKDDAEVVRWFNVVHLPHQMGAVLAPLYFMIDAIVKGSVIHKEAFPYEHNDIHNKWAKKVKGDLIDFKNKINNSDVVKNYQDKVKNTEKTVLNIMAKSEGKKSIGIISKIYYSTLRMYSDCMQHSVTIVREVASLSQRTLWQLSNKDEANERFDAFKNKLTDIRNKVKEYEHDNINKYKISDSTDNK